MEYWCWGCGKIFNDNFDIIREKVNIRGIVDKNVKGKIGGYDVVHPSVVANDMNPILITTCYVYEVLNDIWKIDGMIKNRINWWDPKRKMVVSIEKGFSQDIYSQDGEELFLRSKYGIDGENGIYVDVGCHHPFRFSNTQWAYEMGWRGINIDPNVEAMKLFEIYRKRDINLACGISDCEGTLEYYCYKDGAINTFCVSERREEIVQNISVVPVRRLDSIFNQYDIEHIDFIDIDVEGMEDKVIYSIDFSKVTIDTILVEQLPKTKGYFSIEDIISTNTYEFLISKGYSLTNKYNRTAIYERR